MVDSFANGAQAQQFAAAVAGVGVGGDPAVALHPRKGAADGDFIHAGAHHYVIGGEFVIRADDHHRAPLGWGHVVLGLVHRGDRRGYVAVKHPHKVREEFLQVEACWFGGVRRDAVVNIWIYAHTRCYFWLNDTKAWALT